MDLPPEIRSAKPVIIKKTLRNPHPFVARMKVEKAKELLVELTGNIGD